MHYTYYTFVRSDLWQQVLHVACSVFEQFYFEFIRKPFFKIFFQICHNLLRQKLNKSKILKYPYEHPLNSVQMNPVLRKRKKFFSSFSWEFLRKNVFMGRVHCICRPSNSIYMCWMRDTDCDGKVIDINS